MGVAARLLDGDDLVVHLEVAAGQERAPVDDHVDLVGAGRDGVLVFGELDRHARPAAGERGGDAGDLDTGAAQLLDGDRDQVGVDADGGDTGHLGSAGSGRLALAHSARTLPGVSWPSNVVRSIIVIARSMAHGLAVVLIERVDRVAARASAPTWSTPGRPWRKRRKQASDEVISSYSIVRSTRGGAVVVTT